MLFPTLPTLFYITLRTRHLQLLKGQASSFGLVRVENPHIDKVLGEGNGHLQ